MFGFSIPKLLILILLIVIIWNIFRIIEKRNKKKEEDYLKGTNANYNHESLVECKICGDFYSKKSTLKCPSNHSPQECPIFNQKE